MAIANSGSIGWNCLIKKYVDKLIRLQIRLSDSLTKKFFLTLQSLKNEVTNANTAPMSSKYNSFCGSLSNTLSSSPSWSLSIL